MQLKSIAWKDFEPQDFHFSLRIEVEADSDNPAKISNYSWLDDDWFASDLASQNTEAFERIQAKLQKRILKEFITRRPFPLIYGGTIVVLYAVGKIVANNDRATPDVLYIVVRLLDEHGCVLDSATLA